MPSIPFRALILSLPLAVLLPPPSMALSLAGSGGTGVTVASEAGTGLYLSLSLAMLTPELLPGTGLFFGPLVGAAFQRETIEASRGDLLFVENAAFAALVGGATFSHRKGIALSLFFGPEQAFFFSKMDADWNPDDGALSSSKASGSVLGISLARLAGPAASGRITASFHFNDRDDTISIAFEGGFLK